MSALELARQALTAALAELKSTGLRLQVRHALDEIEAALEIQPVQEYGNE